MLLLFYLLFIFMLVDFEHVRQSENETVFIWKNFNFQFIKLSLPSPVPKKSLRYIFLPSDCRGARSH